MKRPPRPVESFGPKLMAALLVGATKGLTLPMTYNHAVRFRQRVYQLRTSMHHFKHEKYPLVARVKISITWPLDTSIIPSGRTTIPDDRSTLCTLVIAPSDSEFDDVLARAGVSLPDIDIDDVLLESEQGPGSNLADLLRGVKAEGEK